MGVFLAKYWKWFQLVDKYGLQSFKCVCAGEVSWKIDENKRPDSENET